MDDNDLRRTRVYDPDEFPETEYVPDEMNDTVPRDKGFYDTDVYNLVKKPEPGEQKQEEPDEFRDFKDVPRQRTVRKKKHYFRKFLIVVAVIAGVIALML